MLIYVTIIAAMIVISGAAGRLRPYLRRGAAGASLLAEGARRREPQRLQRLRDARGGLGARALPVSPLGHGHLCRRIQRNTIRRNMALLPAYSLVLGLLGLLLGYMALASGVKDMPQFAPYFQGVRAELRGAGALPATISRRGSWAWHSRRSASARWCAAAIMSIAAANLYTRNVHREFVNRSTTPEQETNVAKLVSLLVKVGAVAFILALPLTYAIQLQLLGGIWIIQTLPALVLGSTPACSIIGAFLSAGRWASASERGWPISLKLAGSIFTINLFGYAIPGYAAVWALIVNLVVAIVVSVAVKVMGLQHSGDRTRPEDYLDVAEG